MLVLVRSFYYIADASFVTTEPFTFLVLVLVRSCSNILHVLLRSFYYNPHASFSEEFLIHFTG